MSTEPIIDAHAMLGIETHLALDAAELLRRMDASGVSRAVARSMGSGLVVDHRAGNDELLSAGERICALVSANPWWNDKALDELARCRDRGALGLFLDPMRQGFMPTEAVVDTLLNRAADYRWPVMFRTGAYVNADVLALAEIARRYPQTSFIAGFGGFADMWFELPGVFASVPNLFLDASMMWGEAIREIVRDFGASRVLFAGGEPRNRYAVNLRTLDRLALDPVAHRAILHDNAASLFGLDASMK